MKSRRGLGDAGERIALRYLIERGYTLIEANWRCSLGELDLVMSEGSVLVFVEVRTRRGDALGTPEESVTAAKRNRLAALATQWLDEHLPDPEPPDWRVDVVGVHLSSSGKVTEVNHVPHALAF